MNLTEAIKDMHETNSKESRKNFSELLRTLSEENSQVYSSARPMERGFAIDTVEHTGNVYCIMFSDFSMTERREGSKLCRIGICNLIDSCYANPHLAGIVINPGSIFPVYIQRKDMQILSGKPDPRLIPREWGKGIPDYSEDDVMVAEEAFEFAMEIVAEYGISKEKYEIIETNNGLTSFPNFVCLKENQLYYISVDVALAPKMPTLNTAIIPEMIKIGNENNAKVLYAPVSFASSDPERMKAGIALVGDRFIGNFTGFLPLN